MKLTKKLEAEILKLYNAYWDNYLKGDVEAMHPLLADEYTQVGSAESEVFPNKKDAVQFLYDTIDQVAGKLEMRNRKTIVEQQAEAILIHEFCDLYALADGNWIFYSRFRASTFMQQKKEGWKIAHQHSSFPDAKAEDGQNIAIDKIAAENLQLREAVKRRTIELENKNRELEIETALEKVRTVAMAMKKADDMLLICKTISQQLAKLGVKEIRNVQTAIFYESRGTYMNYEYYAKHDKTFITDVDFKTHKIQMAFAKKMMKGPNEEVLEHLKGKKLQDWYAFQKTTNQFADKYLLKAHSLNYYWYSLGPVALGTSTYYPLTKEETDLFKRFLKVFELAYRRYLDIEKAEAQTREAQIEASLEKVRAQALGMRKAEDLPNVCEVLYKELQALGFTELRNAMVNIHNDDKRTFVNYDYSDEIGKSVTPLFYDIHPVIKKQIKQIRSADDAFSETVFKGKDLESWKAFRKSRGEKADKRINNSTALYYYFYSIGTGSIGISTFNQIAKEKQEVLKRFRNVFAFAYRRYMDVAQAEAQAQEAQIELGLERVRARAMAMQHSDELAELVTVVFNELTHLDFHITSSIIWINNPELLTNTLWVTSAEMNQPAQPIQLDPFQHPFFHSIIHAWKEKDPKWIYLLTGKEKSSFEKSFFKGAPGLPNALKSALTVPENVVFSATFNNFGALELIGTEPLTDKKFDILHRFGKVFDSSYTRFNDLQKAEAQTKEGQIQLALERVRARTMAMQTSEELPQAANLLFQQLQSLGMPAWSAGYCIWDEDKQGITLWMSSEGVMQPSFHAPLTKDPSFIHMREAFERRQDFHVEEVGGKALVKHYKYMRTLPVVGKVLDSIIDAGHPLPTFQIFHCVYFSQGFLLFITYEPVPEAHEIFKRFGKVFDLTYTRFNDLQKAEAQAREAQIEASLERVRSRTMAMQQSNELGDVATVLFKEMNQLVKNLWTCGFVLCEKDGAEDEWWLSIENGFIPAFYLPNTGDRVHKNLYAGWKNGEVYRTEQIEGEELDLHYEWLMNMPVSKKIFDDMAAAGFEKPTWQKLHAAYFSKGYLCIITREPCPEEDVFNRFAQVFDLTYTRFLDLQKAEAQAREAQIEVALERVRSRSIGMQKSEELKDVIKVVYDQLVHLNIKLDHAGFVVDYQPKADWHFWIADKQEIPSKIIHPYFESVWATQFNNAKEKGEELIVTYLNFEEKNKFYNELLSYVPGLPQASKDFYLNCPALAASTVVLENIGLYIENFEGIPYSDDENIILMRFGKVFQQTYTRFLDLQKAEAQAREAQIEAAMEKVRSRSLAMQKPDELAEVAELLRKEMGQLGVEELETSSIYIVDKEKKQTECWYAIKDIREENKQLVSDEMTITFADTWVGTEMGKFYQSKKEQASIIMKGNNRKEWINYCAGKSKVLQGYYGDEIPERTYHLVKFSGGYMGAASPGKISAESWDLLKRAVSVFSLAYTRFNDLQIAEAHALQAEQDLIAIKEAKQKAEEALTELQATQKQLIQAEKMASLGELTAGIAHEIQNPLNFVNNFSEVSKELLDEMKEAIEKGDTEDAKEIMNDVIQNLEKINHHGKRADGIVKGMLQHSSSGSGKKEPTDINALADEYLRLAYHGLRAKDKTFNAIMKTDFDESIGNINIIPQDIGRVILNLITNAFYVVDEKKKSGVENYEPTVSIITKKVADKVLIAVKDNGNGIPQKVLDKIFQPFFTTKPTGQGTGLGLSLSYDIVKAHGGELRVTTKEAEGTEFIVSLPL